MFLSNLLAIWALAHIYVAWRVVSVPFIARHVPRWALAAALALLFPTYVLARVVDRTALSVLARPLEVVGATWMGVLFLTLCCVLAADLVTAFGLLWRRRAPAIRGWALVAAAVLSLIALVQGLRPPIVRDHEIRLAGLPPALDGTVLVFISDLHLGTMIGEGWLAARIAQIDRLRPDLVVVGGDVFEGDSPRELEMLPTLRRLSAPMGVWAVPGNHDGHGRTAPGGSAVADAGFRVLANAWRPVAPGLILAGVADARGRRAGGAAGDPVRLALSDRPPGVATIFVSHVPVGAEAAARAGAGLMLAAHTHGGQIWPFGYLVRMNTPLLAGRYDVGGMPVLVCRGTGTFGPRMRLWQPGEILRIILRAA